MTDYQSLLPLLNEAADIAGQIALKYFRQNLVIDAKEDRSPVTKADREIEIAIRDLLAKRYPTHGIIGEEFGSENEGADFVWVIDPIDGTRAFMTGKPLFGTILGVMHRGKPVAGCVDQPYTKERWLGIHNVMASHNGKPIAVAAPRTLKDTRLYTGSPLMFEGKNFDAYMRLIRQSAWPQYCCDCYAYGLLAMGCADLVVEQDLKIYDIAGVAPIITGAGGYVATWDLKPIGFDFPGDVVASSSRELAAEAAALFG